MNTLAMHGLTMDYLGDIRLAPAPEPGANAADFEAAVETLEGMAVEAPKRRGRPGWMARAARELGVSPSHLGRVVKGGRCSPELAIRCLRWMRINKVYPG